MKESRCERGAVPAENFRLAGESFAGEHRCSRFAHSLWPLFIFATVRQKPISELVMDPTAILIHLGSNSKRESDKGAGEDTRGTDRERKST